MRVSTINPKERSSGMTLLEFILGATLLGLVCFLFWGIISNSALNQLDKDANFAKEGNMLDLEHQVPQEVFKD